MPIMNRLYQAEGSLSGLLSNSSTVRKTEVGFLGAQEHHREDDMERYTIFLKLYNELADFLTAFADSDEYERFYRLVELASEKSSVVKLHAQELKKYGDFRNVIVHNNEFASEPTEETLERFQTLLQKIFSPEKLLPAFQKDVRCFAPSESVAVVLGYLRLTGYSQVVVQAESGLDLLTLDGIGRWISLAADDGTVLLKKSAVEEVLEHESQGNFRVMTPQQTIYDAKEAFSQRIGPRKIRLQAIIITANGSSKEKPLGLVTPWDVLEDTSH